MKHPQIAIAVSAYRRPDHLRRCLASLAAQIDAQDLMEVVVTDDGSAPEILEVVTRFADQVPFPVRFTTHSHRGFRLARCRNEGAAVTTAAYLLFTDGDCLLPPDHLQQHLRRRQPGFAVAGGYYRLDAETSARINEASLRDGSYQKWASPSERRRIALKALRARFYELIRHPMRPRLSGNNIGLWRSDFERVNGFDENYVGWGLEDRDLQRRLGRLGIRFKSILPRSVLCHLWHAPEPSFVRNNTGTSNLAYYNRDAAPLVCPLGLAQRKQDCPHRSKIGRLEHIVFEDRPDEPGWNPDNPPPGAGFPASLKVETVMVRA